MDNVSLLKNLYAAFGRGVTFPRFFVFQGSGIKPRSSAHAAS